MTDDPDSPHLSPAPDPGPVSGTDPDLDIAIVARDPAWRAVHPQCEALCEAAVRAACRQAGAALAQLLEARGGELALVLADDAFVRELNSGYRGQDKPTNVLAFAHSETRDDVPAVPEADEPRPLGDVVLARETVLREAAEQGKAPEDHLRHLVVHGVLHLLGYDHQTEAEARVMEAQEVAALAGLGIGDPYALERAAAMPREGGRL